MGLLKRPIGGNSVKGVLPPGKCMSERCGEPGNEGPSDEAGLGGTLSDCLAIGPRCKNSVLSSPDGKCCSPALLKSWLA